VTLFTRQTARGRCPCGAEHAACGPPSTVTPIDVPIEEVAAVSGPLKKYRYTSEAGHVTVLKLSEEDAERHGLTDADLLDAPAPEAAAKARPAAQNKARGARNKGGAGGGG
jgi:hypothetical protein